MLLERLFTAGSVLPQDMTLFSSREGLMAPAAWSLEAVRAFQEALVPAPRARKLVEENTLPSWLWQHRAEEGSERLKERHVMAVFDRIAGAATYHGWKRGLWQDEIEASTFYDETRALLATRRLVLAPRAMARMGLDWAYGEKAVAEKKTAPVAPPATLILQNESIDAILSGSHPAALGKWNRFLDQTQRQSDVRVAFADTMAEWHTLPLAAETPRALLNLMAFRQEDGTLDLAGLRHAAGLGVLLLDLHAGAFGAREGAESLALGLGDLASLLMSLGLPYDSDQGRATAAALAGLVTASATRVSAEMAARLGAGKSFVAQRESLLRAFENRVRAAFDEKNDYDRLSVRPQTLRLDSGLDLVLLSAARHAFEEAEEAVRAHGLRHVQLTALFEAPETAALMNAFAQSAAPLTQLSCAYESEDKGGDIFETRLAPALALGTERAGLDAADRRAVADHVTGYRSLAGAPFINPAVLREKGFGEAQLRAIDAALTQASSIRQAFTPWTLGVDFCRDVLGLGEAELKNPAFDLLRFLKFSTQDIALADAFCCGHGHVRGVLELNERLWPVFRTHADLPPESLIHMAAALQPFVTGEIDLALRVPARVPAQARGALILMAWELGLRGLALDLDGATPAEAEEPMMKRQTPSLAATPPRPIPAPRTASKSRAPRSPSLRPLAGFGVKEKRG